ncbi:MAG: hypothetical protein HC775_05295 [Hyellaceae cyanobacterium CSU_1_1]|nr:hypothetical protein [Hyellaceae cyanobacterium CSU_1_1]
MSSGTVTRKLNIPRQKISPGDKLLSIFQTLLDDESPAILSAIADSLDRVRHSESSDDEFVKLLSDQEYVPEERKRLHIQNVINSFNYRRELLKDTVDVNQVMEILGYDSRQAPLNRLKAGSLIAIKDNQKWWFPLWQFDANTSDGIVDGLSRVLKALDCSNLAKVSWLVNPNPYFANSTPLYVLKTGDVERVVESAQSVGLVV